MFGTKVEFSGLADRVDLLLVEPNRRGGLRSSCKISNEYMPISGMRYLIHFMRAALQEYGENNARGVIRLVTI